MKKHIFRLLITALIFMAVFQTTVTALAAGIEKGKVDINITALSISETSSNVPVSEFFTGTKRYKTAIISQKMVTFICTQSLLLTGLPTRNIC